MPEGDHLQLPHIPYLGNAHAGDYTHPRTPTKIEFRRASKSRSTQAQSLQDGIARARQTFNRVRQAQGIDDENESDYGLVLRVESEPGFPLKVQSFDRGGAKRKRDDIELLNVRTIGQRENQVTIAAVFVPFGKLPQLEKMVGKYEKEDNTRSLRPKNEDLFVNIRSIRYAALEALWTDSAPLPELAQESWWEVWIRRGATNWEEQFIKESEAVGIDPGSGHLRLPEHLVRLIRGTREQIEASLGVLNCLAEVRLPRACSLPFIEMDSADQQEWINEALGRVDYPEPDSPAVCLLDCGVNRGHKLLEQLLDEEDMHTVHGASGTADHPHLPHGTGMAGLAAYGNLTELLSSTQRWRQEHRLESVKMLKNAGDHEPGLYGLIAQQAISLAEISPRLLRSFCCAITAPPSSTDGRPSSWSAAMDSAAAGAMEGDEADNPLRRLIFTAAGNFRDFVSGYSYPDTLLEEGASIEDPAQAWNTVTVGAMTHFDQIHEQDDEAQRSTAIARAGGLAPTSRTSAKWIRHWPYKPDIVMEGGNMARTVQGENIPFRSLRPLTTSPRFPTPFFTTFADTSAATALAARLGARLQCRYPAYWSETIRGLVVHSARWTPQMLNGIDPHSTQASTIKHLLRQVGWGEPDSARALASASNKATIICENDLQPFRNEGRTNHWHTHALPWPQELLLNAGATDVVLRVTLSYFIEPNPGSRSVPNFHLTRNRYRYAGCGLRFEIKGPTESTYNFLSRLNQLITNPDEVAVGEAEGGSSREGWVLGTRGRRIGGSLHQDIWRGPAANLARMDEIAVFPVKGWWATRKFPVGHECHNCHERKIRYSLIVSIETEVNLPIYNTISALILQKNVIEAVDLDHLTEF